MNRIEIRPIMQGEGRGDYQVVNVNRYPEQCDGCGKRRTCSDDGLCHECHVAESLAFLCDSCLLPTDDCTCDGGPYIAGGRAL